jgi:uroporphyrinogen-III synthase
MALATIPLFAVGAATAKTMRQALGQCNIVNGSNWETGQVEQNAEGLSSTIKAYYRDSPPPKTERKSLLFLSGDKRRDVLPAMLQESSVPLTEIVVYETSQRVSLEIAKDMKDIVGVKSVTVDAHPTFLVCFSPSGVEVIHQAIRCLTEEGACGVQSLVFVAIGSTTAGALVKNGVACLVSPKPSPEGVSQCIQTHLCNIKMVLP